MRNIKQISAILLIPALLLTGCAGSLSKGLSEYFGRVFWDMILYQGAYSVMTMEMITVATAINFGRQDRFQFFMPTDSLDMILQLDESIKLRNTFEYFKMRIDSINIDYFVADKLIAESRTVDIDMRNAESLLIRNGSLLEDCIHVKMAYFFGQHFEGEGNISFSKIKPDPPTSISKPERSANIDESFIVLEEYTESGPEDKDCPYIYKSIFYRKEIEVYKVEKAEVTSYFSFEFVKTRFDTLQIREDALSLNYKYEEFLPILDSADKIMVELLENLDNNILPSGRGS